LVKPKTFYRHYQNVSIFCFKKYESLLAEDQRIAHEIQKKQEEERDSELEKNKITVSYSFQPINFCIIDFRVILLHLVFLITLRYLLRLFGVISLFTSPIQLSEVHNLNHQMLIFAFYKNMNHFGKIPFYFKWGMYFFKNFYYHIV
jgi:hypothetical protein